MNKFPIQVQSPSTWLMNIATDIEDVVDNDSQCISSHGLIRGLVKFDFGNVYHPHFGNIHVKSQYSRLKPKFERKHVESHDLEALVNKLMVWVNCYLESTERQEYLKEVALAATLFTVYANPQPEMYTTNMYLGMKFCFWLWYTDDIIEDAIANKISYKVLKQVTDQLEGILMGKYDNAEQFLNVPNCPQFGYSLNLLFDLHISCKKTVEEYEKRVDRLYLNLQKYLGAHKWYCVDEIDERYSEETYKTWRKVIGGVDLAAEFFALIHGIILPAELVRSPTYERILDILNAIVAFTNDLLGMKNECHKGSKDNLIVFKVLKGIPSKEAVQQVCQLLNSELSDYVLLKQAILQEFNHEDSLVKYLDMLDSFIDGHHMVYVECPRYRCVGSVLLTR